MAAVQTMLTARRQRREGRFVYLLLAQVLLLASFPYLEKPGLPSVVFRLLGAAAFLSGIYAVSEKRAQWITAVVLVMPTGVLNAMFAVQPERRIAVPTLLCTLLFLLFTLVSLLRAVIRAEKVSPDTIYGALSVYLMMALVWGTAYLLLETVHPGSIAMDPTRHPNHTMDWYDCMFYSYVTLTTLGYGDIVPVTAQARSLTILEAVSGMMYVAVLIARLVGLYSAANSGSRPASAPDVDDVSEVIERRTA